MKIKITREDLLKKAIQKQLAKQQAVEDYENNNLMKTIKQRGNKMVFNKIKITDSDGSSPEKAIVNHKHKISFRRS